MTTDPAEHKDADREEQWAEVEVSSLAVSLRVVPAWLVSLVVHMALLLGLAICTFANPDAIEKTFVSGSQMEPQEELIEELANLDIESLQVLEKTDEWSLFREVVAPGAIAFGDLSAPAEIEAADGIGEIALSETTIDEIGALFGGDGNGMSDIGDGLKAAASIFGAKARGRKFVFVVDNSNSMTRGRFETALNELMRTVQAMSPRQRFYVIFFSDTAYRMSMAIRIGPGLTRWSVPARWLPSEAVWEQSCEIC